MTSEYQPHCYRSFMTVMLFKIGRQQPDTEMCTRGMIYQKQFLVTTRHRNKITSHDSAPCSLERTGLHPENIAIFSGVICNCLSSISPH